MGWRSKSSRHPISAPFRIHPLPTTHNPLLKKVPPGYAGGRVPPRRSRGGDGRRRVHRTQSQYEKRARRGPDPKTRRLASSGWTLGQSVRRRLRETGRGATAPPPNSASFRITHHPSPTTHHPPLPPPLPASRRSRHCTAMPKPELLETFENPYPDRRSEERRVGKECRSRWS